MAASPATHPQAEIELAHDTQYLMNSQEISALVAERAARFGDRNSQQFEQLVSRLKKLEESTVADGLLRVFTDGNGPPLGSAAQELAGALLAQLMPRSSIELEPFLRAALPKYELSVEQLPDYLARRFGPSELDTALQRLDRDQFGASYRRAIDTFRFWLRGR